MKRAMGEAYVKGDGAALDRIYADEYVVTDPDGSRRSKADEIRAIRSSTRTYESSSYGDVTVRIYGDTATESTAPAVGYGTPCCWRNAANSFMRSQEKTLSCVPQISRAPTTSRTKSGPYSRCRSTQDSLPSEATFFMRRAV